MTALVIANTQIRCDAAGRYCLNDLHQASGGEGRHRPGRWLDSEKTRELVAEVENFPATTAGIPAVVTAEGFGGGTYAVKELVYAYAMWISAAFHLQVIRAYDALVQQRTAPRHALAAQPQHRADQIVSAGRVFAAAFRTARAARVPYPQALQAATDCAQRHTGIDWRDELGLQAPVHVPAAAQARAGSPGAFLAALTGNGIAGLRPMAGLTTDWYTAYACWCTDAGTWAAAMPLFVNTLERQHGVAVRRLRWGAGRRVAELPVNSFLMLGDTAPRAGAVDAAWLGEQLAACKAMIDRYIADPARVRLLDA